MLFDANILRGLYEKFSCSLWPDIESYLPFLANLLNAYDKEHTWSDFEAELMPITVIQHLTARPYCTTGAEVKDKVIAVLRGEHFGPPAALKNIQPPALAPTPASFGPPRPRVTRSIPHLRNRVNSANGRKLAGFALEQKGKFRWIPRGEEGSLPVSTTTHPSTGQGVNTFWQWLQGGVGEYLPEQAALNCWEVVLYCACCAGLLPRGQLRGIYEEALQKSQTALGETRRYQLTRQGTTTALNQGDRAAHQQYVEHLYAALHGPSAVRVRPRRDGDWPAMGDIVFVNGMAHVCISLGHREEGGKMRGWVMSLWHHNQGRFSLLSLKDLGDEHQNEISIIPCPF